jgi:DsbC/DsbD-like thiol-disulfide interchange protein
MRHASFAFSGCVLVRRGLAARAASSSADAAHLHVQLVSRSAAGIRGQRRTRPAFISSWSRAGMFIGKTPAIRASRRASSWTLPKGITAGPLQFPAPKRLPLGPLMDFGYEDEVLSLLKLHVIKTAKPARWYSMPRWIGSFAAKYAFPARPILKTKRCPHRQRQVTSQPRSPT